LTGVSDGLPRVPFPGPAVCEVEVQHRQFKLIVFLRR
jgi:hypothetical protein